MSRAPNSGADAFMAIPYSRLLTWEFIFPPKKTGLAGGQSRLVKDLKEVLMVQLPTATAKRPDQHVAQASEEAVVIAL